MPTYTYSCVCGWHADLRGKWDVKSVPCSDCHRDVRRAEVNTINFGGFARTPPSERDWSGDFHQFQEATKDIDGRATDIEKREGVAIKTPNLMKAAKARVQELTRKGVKDVNDLS